MTTICDAVSKNMIEHISCSYRYDVTYHMDIFLLPKKLGRNILVITRTILHLWIYNSSFKKLLITFAVWDKTSHYTSTLFIYFIQPYRLLCCLCILWFRLTLEARFLYLWLFFFFLPKSISNQPEVAMNTPCT